MPAARRRTPFGALLVALVLSSTLSACFDAEDLVGNFDLCGGAGPVARVELHPTQVTVRAGESVQILLNELDSRGRDRMFCGGPSPSWTSVDTTIAVVRSQGYFADVRAVNPGTTTIRAQVPPGPTGSTTVTVVPR